MEIDPAARLTELAQAQKRLDDAMAQLATAIPEREVRALGSCINELLAAFARASKRESSERYLICLSGDVKCTYIVYSIDGIISAYFNDVMGGDQRNRESDEYKGVVADVYGTDAWVLACDGTRLQLHYSFEDGSFTAYRIMGE